MYSMEQFEQALVPWLEASLKSKYGNVNIVTERVKKINCELTGIKCEVPDGRNSYGPIVYLEKLYDKYLQNEDYIQTLVDIREVVIAAIEDAKTFKNQHFNPREAHDSIIFHFIHTEQNKEYLETLPHREFHDLSIVYRWIVEQSEEGIASVQINDALACVMGLDEDELYQLAYENTRRMFPTCIRPIQEVIKSFQMNLSNDDIPEFDVSKFEKEHLLYVISNHVNEKGAVNVLYTDELQKLSEQVESDLFLLPSSLHEMMAIPEHVMDLETMAKMVYEVNQMVEIEDRLSNEVYKYDRVTQSIVQVTDSEHKMVVEELDKSMGMEMC